MSNLAKLEFMALDITGKNYLSWALDAEIHLNANNLGDTIKEGNKTSTQDKAKAMIFLRHHIHESLKNEYLTIKDPLVLWTNLKERYDHQKTVILPRARYEWINLKLQDLKSISEYNSAMFRIMSQLILCGENITDKEMLEKTFSTFHASNIVLQQQYRERGFTIYSDLISCLLVAEQNNELQMKNHETRPVGTTPFPEVNVATYNDQSGSHVRGRGYQRGRGHGRSRGRGHGHGRGCAYGRGNYHGVQFKNKRTHQKLHDNEKKSNDERGKKKSGTSSNACYRCVGNVDVPSGEKDHTNATNLDYDDFLIEQANLDSGDIMADTNQLDACNFPYA
ncbi:uncharacterized protein LOC110919291 [Helianthus annuus]|uniref:uncharacterized protein LOC110919291 n=1 Tax=Helianthus annuus TaxID=4232 RepID=UPI000B8FE6F6|nr:uncharacterized protein LOC110919291 [Helianthus annuus]